MSKKSELEIGKFNLVLTITYPWPDQTSAQSHCYKIPKIKVGRNKPFEISSLKRHTTDYYCKFSKWFDSKNQKGTA